MEPKRLYYGELRFLNIIWENEPVASGELVRLCLQEFGWKKSTTYTMLKRLGEKQLICNENTIVTSLVSRAEVQAAESKSVVQQTFGGSLPGFLVAFLGNKKLSNEEAEAIQRLIDEHREN